MNLLPKVFIILLIFPCTILAEKISFRQNFPDQQLRGKSFELSRSNYLKAVSLSLQIYAKEIEIDQYMRTLDKSKHWKEQVAGWNKLRTENWYLIEELRSIINESQK
jgi:hypothetical protein